MATSMKSPISNLKKGSLKIVQLSNFAVGYYCKVIKHGKDTCFYNFF